MWSFGIHKKYTNIISSKSFTKVVLNPCSYIVSTEAIMFEVVCRFLLFSEAFAESPVSTDTQVASKAFFEVTTISELSIMALPIGAV